MAARDGLIVQRMSVRLFIIVPLHQAEQGTVRIRDDTHAATHQDVDFDTTAEAAQASLEAQRVRRALATLTDAQRSAVELAYLGGYTHTEVATLLDLPLGTAKTRIRDGLIRLRDTLGVPA